MVSHTAQLGASGQAVKFSTVLSCQSPDLSSEQKQVTPFFAARLQSLRCAKLQLYGYCGSAQSQSSGQ